MKEAILLKNVLPVGMCYFLTHYLSRLPKGDDPQVPGSLVVATHDPIFHTIQERIWPTLEEVVGEELSPTYSYARLYINENVLEKHSDRPSCEVSITIQLGRSHHYSWPIYMGDKRFDLAEGDGVLYPGCDVDHWRDACNGPDGYYSGQLFCHFVKTNGQYKDHYNDRLTHEVKETFVRNRVFAMENK